MIPDFLRGTLVPGLLVFVCSGCQQELVDGQGPEPERAVRALVMAGEVVHLPWGDPQDGGLGFREARDEVPARGPMALKVTGSGSLALLDSLNSRVVFFSPDGVLERSVPVAPLVSLFCVHADGSLTTLSLASMNLERVSPEGEVRFLGRLSAGLKTIVSLECRSSGVEGRTSHQQTFMLEAAEPLACGRDGLGGEDGRFRSLSVRGVGKGRRVLAHEAFPALVKGEGDAEHLVAGWDTDCRSVRLLGTSQTGELGVLCERGGGPRVEVDVVTSLELRSRGGQLLFETTLPPGPAYAMRDGFHVTARGVTVARPYATGLTVTRYDFTGEVAP